MAARLTIDLDALAETSRRLSLIAAEFSSTDNTVDQVTADIGATNDTHELRRAVEDFANKWRVRREGIQGNLVYLADVAGAVADNMTDAETQLATALTDPQPAPAPAPSPQAPPGQGQVA